MINLNKYDIEDDFDNCLDEWAYDFKESMKEFKGSMKEMFLDLKDSMTELKDDLKEIFDTSYIFEDDGNIF